MLGGSPSSNPAAYSQLDEMPHILSVKFQKTLPDTISSYSPLRVTPRDVLH